MYFPDLGQAAFSYPAIDNHAHPILAEKHRDVFPLEGAISEAVGEALAVDSRYTLASYRAVGQLAKLFGLKGPEPTWDAVKNKRNDTPYVDLCTMCFKPTGIQCILLDDGLGGVARFAASNKWHDQFTTSPSKRIVRIETEAEDILQTMLDSDATFISTSIVSVVSILEEFTEKFKARIQAHAQDDHVAGFKSIVCYRTGLHIATSATYEELQHAVSSLLQQYKASASLRLHQKVLNDHLVRLALQIAGHHQKPVQFHTGLGDNDLRLCKSSPSHMQAIIAAYPNTPIVLLHSSYPFAREAAYLTSVYANVYMDFGEIFPMLSSEGQRTAIRQLLELAPTNKILWSTDGHWSPESYYLATVQSRQALYEVLADYVRRHEITEQQAVEIVQNALFHNANRIYKLGLEPDMNLL